MRPEPLSVSVSRVEHLKFGNGHCEFAAPCRDMFRLLHDFVLQIPREDQNVVRPRLRNPFRRVDGEMGARKTESLLVWIAVDRKGDIGGGGAAGVQQRIALGGSAVGNNG